MRIAYLCADPGVPVFGTKGASVHIQEIVRAFRGRGDEVTVYATRRGDLVPDDLADLRVVEVRVPRGDTAVRERGVTDAARQLAAAAVADGCDLVYERFALFSDGGARAADDAGVPLVLEVNAPLIEEQRTHRELVDDDGATALAAASMRAATVVACVSEPVAAWASRHGARAPLVAPNGVNTARIRPSNAARPADDVPTVGFVGTLKHWHGVDVLLDAAAELSRRGCVIRLSIVGDGPAGAELREQADRLGLDARFTGAVAPEEIPAHLAAIDVGVAPYREADDYFSPLKVCEYLAAGIPVVASRVGQLPMLVDDGATGSLVVPGDPIALADALAALVSDPETRERWAVAARDRAVRDFDWSGVLARILRDVPETVIV
ncbi:glycosyltransferase family 4 protein [Agromyces atrinae]|uniref:glycosyltransferase family 4 protein n=1 Tax=Agromyces atrinae TaxID=592376 RepID=UPI001F5A295E|nr:glycosyltransferase family 4 protein [Agromyces atrinae]MCI2956221.1 glycosyltransferase family 4 protein [Agromyces atrinae]